MTTTLRTWVAVAALVGSTAVLPATASPSQAAERPTTTAAARCSAKGLPGRVQGSQRLTVRARATATAIFRQAVHCDAASLTRRASRDKTRLSFGVVTPRDYFALPDQENRYADLVRAMSRTQPAYEKHSRSYVWPRLATGAHDADPAAWAEVVRAGLLTQKQADAMRRAGSGYMGYRVAISTTGTWSSFVAGD